MLLEQNECDPGEPLFRFYRVGWMMARQGMGLPEIDQPSIPWIKVWYAQYDLRAGYCAYIHHVTNCKGGRA
jgi:hypothetical protein